jgi:SOS-response transcriptional repressor LexA
MQGLTKRQAQTLDYIRQSIEERGYPPTLREIGEFMGIRSTNGVNDHLRALERKGYLRREDMKSRALRLVHDPDPARRASDGLSGPGQSQPAQSYGAMPGYGVQPAAQVSPANLVGQLPFEQNGTPFQLDASAPAPSFQARVDGRRIGPMHAVGQSAYSLGSGSVGSGSVGSGSVSSGSAGPMGSASHVEDENVVAINVLGRVAAGLPLLAEQNVIDTVRVDRMLVRGGREVFGLRVQGDSMIEAGILNGDYIFVRKQSTAERGQIVVALIGEEATVKYYFPERDYIRFQPANSEMAPILVRATDFKPTMLLGVVVGVYRRL